jgi:exosome complex exonuclease DIS3/RRP44
MLHKRQAVRKTRKGNVVKVITEHYLRDDISCGAEVCTICQQALEKLVLPHLPPQPTELRAYWILHTSVLLHQMDMLEHKVRKIQSDHHPKQNNSSDL